MAFKRKCYLKSHIKVHAVTHLINSKNNGKFHCYVCDKAFVENYSSWANHILCHSEIKSASDSACLQLCLNQQQLNLSDHDHEDITSQNHFGNKFKAFIDNLNEESCDAIDKEKLKNVSALHADESFVKKCQFEKDKICDSSVTYSCLVCKETFLLLVALYCTYSYMLCCFIQTT